MRKEQIEQELEAAKAEVEHLSQLLTKTTEELKQQKETLLEEYSSREPERYVCLSQDFLADPREPFTLIESRFELIQPREVQILVQPGIPKNRFAAIVMEMVLALLEESNARDYNENAGVREPVDRHEIPF